MPLLNLSDTSLFRPDRLSWVMAVLIVFVIANVAMFSRRYMAGDRNHRRHLLGVTLLGLGVLMTVMADHMLMILGGWAASNLSLTVLMIHKGEWLAARYSGLLAGKTFLVGIALLAVGFGCLAESAGTASVQGVIAAADSSSALTFAGLLAIAVAAMSQSAAWPFHRWLVSSLNSPTPVSALMHAGLVNGGGFLLARFAPLYLKQPAILHMIFAAGLVTAIVGSFWKLIQPDIKRMLACSTMGQMGFMLMQCGMGLFAPAVSHLCWHGLFKAFLFLGSGSVVKEKRSVAPASGSVFARLPIAAVAGLAGAWAFARTSGIAFDLATTSCVMTGLAFLAAMQFGLKFVDVPTHPGKAAGAILAGIVAGALYGSSVLAIDLVLEPLHIMQPQPLDALYVAGLGVIALVWLAMNTGLAMKLQGLPSFKRLYVTALNASQPHPQTVTATRTTYRI